jgi:hypothetical protein
MSRKRKQDKPKPSLRVNANTTHFVTNEEMRDFFHEHIQGKKPVPVSTFIHEQGKPTKIKHEMAGEHPTRFADPVEEKQTSLALTDEQLAQSNARLAAIRDSMKDIADGKQMDDEIDQRLANSIHEPRHHFAKRDEDGKATSAAKEAELAARKAETTEDLRQAKADKDDDKWFEAVYNVIDDMGVFWLTKAFCVVAGTGAGVATIIYLFGGK